ncbi:hypothetical protein ACT691_06805 [Vibrio metschnikovii]
MSWIQLTSVTATNNSNVIVVNTGSTVGIKAGDALPLAGFDLAEVEGVFATSLQLRKTMGLAQLNQAFKRLSCRHSVILTTLWKRLEI